MMDPFPLVICCIVSLALSVLYSLGTVFSIVYFFVTKTSSTDKTPFLVSYSHPLPMYRRAYCSEYFEHVMYSLRRNGGLVLQKFLVCTRHGCAGSLHFSEGAFVREHDRCAFNAKTRQYAHERTSQSIFHGHDTAAVKNVFGCTAAV